MAGAQLTARRLLAAGLVCCLASACAGSDPASSAPKSSPPAAKSASSPARSGAPAAPQVIVHVPQRHGRIGVVVLHSLDHGPAELVAEGWNAAADRHGFVAIYPNRAPDWNAGLCCGAAVKANRDDVGWLTDQIRAEQAKYSLTSVYLAGDSNGGMMVERLVAQEPGISQRFAVWGSAPEWTQVSPWRGIGFLFSGAHDASAPADGGTVRILGEAVHINPAAGTRQNLPHAQLRFVAFPALGHSPPANWPEIAWQAMQSGRT
jgi:poly(3-hydroxybutyrate) depolymerase